MAGVKVSKYKAGQGKKMPEAIHAEVSGGKHHVDHVVGLKNVRVVIVPDEGSWFAQGLDIDYASQGQGPEEAQNNFAQGLRATIDQHLQAYGHIRELLKPVAPQLLSNLVLDSSAQFKRYAQVSAHEVHKALDYDQIIYLLDQESECAVQSA